MHSKYISDFSKIFVSTNDIINCCNLAVELYVSLKNIVKMNRVY